jgi:hypothetical protein
LPRNGGREVLYTYLQAALASVFGLKLTTLRLTSALAGIATVGVSYVLLRGMLRRDSRRVAALTSAVLAISFWHLHFSHYGIRVIMMPMIFSGVFGFFWLGCRDRRAWPFVVSGALAGLSVWANPTGRLTPFVIGGYALWIAWRQREDKPRPGVSLWAGLLLTGITAFLVFLPLGIEFYRHPDFFFGHASAVSVFAERVGGGSPAMALLRHAVAVLGMFSVQGDRAWIHNLAGRPVFDLLLSIPFWVGVVIYARRLLQRSDPDRDALVMLALWAGVMLLPTMFSDDAPNFSRSLPALPALFVPAGLGLAAIMDFVARPFRDRRNGLAAGYAVAAFFLIVSGVLAVRDYFVRFPNAPEAYYAYDVDKLDAWGHLEPHIGKDAVYLSQLWAEHSTLKFLRRGTDVRSLDSSNTLVLPPEGTGAVYAFPSQQRRRAEQIAALWPGAGLESLADRYGKPLLEIVTADAGSLAGWPAALAPDAPVEVRFDDAPTLLGMRADGGEALVHWRAEAPMARDLTAFLHWIDPDGRKVGQADQQPGDKSYLTPAWKPGERVIERYRPVMDPCRDERPMRVMAGWYELAADGARRPRADGQGDMAYAGEMAVPLKSRPAEQAAPPSPADGRWDGLRLIGFSLDGGTMQAGSPLALELYWACETGDAACAAEVAQQPVSVSLEGAGAPVETIWEGPAAPADADWRAGEVLCRRLVLRLPADAEEGSYTLSVGAGEGAPLPLVELQVEPSTRRYDAPPVGQPTNALLGEEIRLLGATVEKSAARGPLQATLVWQAASSPKTRATVFVHLVDAAGQIVAQSDAQPSGGYPTDAWAAGEVVVDQHILAAAPDATGVYRLYAGMYDPLTGQRLPAWDAAGRPIPDAAVPLGEVTLP